MTGEPLTEMERALIDAPLTEEEKADLLAFDIGTAQDLMTNAAVARAMLAQVSFDLIEQEVYRRGRIVCVASACRFGDRLPPGYPPRAEDDVPFDALEDTRS